METEIMACKPKEKFASYHIKQLLNSDFNRKPQMSTIGSPSAPAPLISPSSTPVPSASVPAYIPIYPTQPSGIGLTPEADPQPVMTTTSTGHGSELSNLEKIYTNEEKHSRHNESFTFKMAIFHDISFRADALFEAKIIAFPTMLKGLTLVNYSSNINISNIVINSNQVRYSIRKK